jgi:hypothetical protein
MAEMISEARQTYVPDELHGVSEMVFLFPEMRPGFGERVDMDMVLNERNRDNLTRRYDRPSCVVGCGQCRPWGPKRVWVQWV